MLDRGGPYLVMTQDFLYRVQKILARFAGYEAVAVDIRPYPAHLQDGSIRKEMSHGRADRLLHSRLDGIRYQNDIKGARLAGLLYIFQAERRLDSVAGTL